MKINFGLLGLAAAQSGDERWEDSSYDYDSGADRWSNNDWNFSNVQAGVTFTDFGGRTTGQLASDNFVKALKLSCWNSNMIRDMNNDNQMDVYARGSSDAQTLYMRGDLQTGNNHQYGFEYTNNQDSDNGGLAGQNEGTTNAAGVGLEAGDASYGIRTGNNFRKWGYQNDNVERAASDGYAEDIVAYHFGHADNTLNTANRPNKFDDCTGDGSSSYDCSGTDGKSANFHGYEDDWRYSLRMGGCLYEAQQWFYDENSFNRVGRLTYSDEAKFILDSYGAGPVVNNNGIFEEDSEADMFNDVNDSVLRTPTAGGVFADVHWVHVFNAHVFPIRDVGYYQHDTGHTNENDSISRSNVHGFKTDAGAAVRASADATLSKKDRQIEDFNVVMANPTYEGHGFLNFVATYHDHVEDYDQGAAEDTEPDRATTDGKAYTYVGYRFLSTIGGLTTATADTRTTCGHVREGITGGTNDNRCGSAVYDNFGDWYFRPAQTYSKKFDSGNEEFGYWAYILDEAYDPYNYGNNDGTYTATQENSLWRAGSGHYDSDVGGRGFSISSFPHNELGKDFRFNIRTLHNMGAGVAKSYQRISGLSAPFEATHLSTSSMVWSYYMYAVDNIKIAFPEYVARINHCTSNSVTCRDEDVQDIIIDGATMKSAAAPSLNSDSRYTDGNTQYGFKAIMGADDHSAAVARLYLDDAAFDYANRDDHDDTHADAQGAANCAAYSFSPNTVTQTNFKEPHGYTENRQPWKPCASWCGLAGSASDPLCGRVLSISGLLSTYDELHLRQYGSIQEVWVQLQYAYFETFDDNRDITNANVDQVRGTESPFPNIFFSAPEVVDIIASCDSSNMKCRGYMNDENQPYAGSRTHNARVYTNAGNGNPAAAYDFHADANWPENTYTQNLS